MGGFSTGFIHCGNAYLFWGWSLPDRCKQLRFHEPISSKLCSPTRLACVGRQRARGRVWQGSVRRIDLSNRRDGGVVVMDLSRGRATY
jgi:hypothetical protein